MLKSPFLKIIITFCSCAIFFSSCDKSGNEKIEIETVSAEIQDNGSVLVKGKIVSGPQPIAGEIGFCMSKSPVPDRSENRILNPARNGNGFEGIYKDLEPRTKYYFRAWSNNKVGASLGSVIMLDSILAKPIVAPCVLEMNTLNDGTLPKDEKYISVTIDNNNEWEIGGYSQNAQIDLIFNEKPETGIYITQQGMDLEKNEVRIRVLMFNYYYALSGAKVYVNEYQDGSYEVTICAAPIKYASGTTYNLRTRLKTKCENIGIAAIIPGINVCIFKKNPPNPL